MLQRHLFMFVLLILLFFVIQFSKVNNIYGQPPNQQQFTVRKGKVEGLNDEQVALMQKAIDIFQIVMNDAQFRRDLAALERVEDNAVIKRPERIKKYKVEYNDINNKLTTQQIVTNLINGTEFFDSRNANNQIIIDNEADIFWRVITKARCYKKPNGKTSCNVRGSTPNKPGSSGRIRDGDYYINTRSWFINQVLTGEQDLFNLVEHLAHEWSHKFGFVDTGGKVKDKSELFPYVFGRLVESSAKRVATNCLSG